MKKSVFFDMDGTLLDSLDAHDTFNQGMSDKYSLNLEICSSRPVIFPYTEYLISLGFPKKLIPEISKEYNNNFSKNKACMDQIRLFEGIEGLLDYVFDEFSYSGIVSSNCEKNVIASLGEIHEKFDYLCSWDSVDNKVEGIIQGLDEFGLKPDELLYVGDAIGDYEAARDSGVNFVGVSYGWQIIPEHKKDFPVVDSVEELKKFIISFQNQKKITE